jgi:hypothetical protein
MDTRFTRSQGRLRRRRCYFEAPTGGLLWAPADILATWVSS